MGWPFAARKFGMTGFVVTEGGCPLLWMLIVIEGAVI